MVNLGTILDIAYSNAESYNMVLNLVPSDAAR